MRGILKRVDNNRLTSPLMENDSVENSRSRNQSLIKRWSELPLLMTFLISPSPSTLNI